MHKSAIILLSSLVMLLPFGTSMNVFSNAMAIEEYEYDTGQYERYAMDIANDYGGEYQSPPASTNDYNNYDRSKNNDFIKKIKCNNINSNINGLDGLTDFGFDGVGEDAIYWWNRWIKFLWKWRISNHWYRNNGYFDLDCINNNDNENNIQEGGAGTPGPQGLPGPRGLQGPAGAAGAAGPNQILPSSLYRVIGPLDTSADIGFAQSFVFCEAGDTAISGSYALNNSNIAQNIADFEAGSFTGWVAQASEGFPGEISIQAIVTCFNNP